MKPFGVFDIDGTLIRWQLYHAISDAFVKLGYVSPEDYQIVKDARMVWKRRERDDDFKPYEKVVIATYEKVLRTLNPAQLEAAVTAVFDEYKDQVYTYPRQLLKNLKRKGYFMLAISGSQVEIVEKMAQYWGFDDYLGTVYTREGEKFTGQKVVHSDDKAAALKSMIKKHKLTPAGSVAIGDTRSDIPMLGMCSEPIAFNPEKNLFVHASSAGWKIVLERKNMVYELEKKDGRYELVKTNNR